MLGFLKRICRPQATNTNASKTRCLTQNKDGPPHRPPALVCQPQATNQQVKLSNSSNFLCFLRKWSIGTALEEEVLAERQRASRVNQVTMKANTTKNLTSVVMIAIASLLMTQAILVRVQTAGISENAVLLLLLSISSAVLSGINGFGRRTIKAASLSAANRFGSK